MCTRNFEAFMWATLLALSLILFIVIFVSKPNYKLRFATGLCDVWCVMLSLIITAQPATNHIACNNPPGQASIVNQKKKKSDQKVFSKFYSNCHCPTTTSTPVGIIGWLGLTTFKALPDNLGSWFSVCYLILTKLDEICKKKYYRKISKMR